MPKGFHPEAAKNNPFKARNAFNEVDFTIGAETTYRDVTVQLLDANGEAIGERAACPFYLSTDAEGDNITASAPNGGIAIQTDGLAIEWTADKAGLLITNSSGVATLRITESGAASFYLVLVMPDGSLRVSDVISFAA